MISVFGFIKNALDDSKIKLCLLQHMKQHFGVINCQIKLMIRRFQKRPDLWRDYKFTNGFGCTDCQMHRIRRNKTIPNICFLCLDTVKIPLQPFGISCAGEGSTIVGKQLDTVVVLQVMDMLRNTRLCHIQFFCRSAVIHLIIKGKKRKHSVI